MTLQTSSISLPREFRAAWVATVDNIDWPSKPGLSSSQQKAELAEILGNAHDLKLNAIIFQIRPHADAMYQSSFEPWSWYLTGDQGTAPNPAWDPLQFAVEECHRLGIELHVWFNPYRAKHPKQLGALHPSHVAVTNPSEVYTYGDYLWMDPGSKFVQDRSYNVFLDVVKRYDIDGVHIDDYFYPYPVKGQDFPDEQRYRDSGTKLSKSDWRRKNVDDFIERVYKGIKSEKPWVKFGISPFGIYRPGIPKGISAGIDQYEALSADALKWFEKGWCDYFTPQLYWPIEQTPQSFPVLLDWWRSVNKSKRHLWAGMYTGQVISGGKNWNREQILRQIELTRKGQSNPGHVHFSYKSLLKDYAGIATSLKSGLYSQRALVPDSRFLSTVKPSTPKVTVAKPNLVIDPDPKVRFYAVVVKANGHWVIDTVTSNTVIPIRTDAKEIQVFAVDRFESMSVPRSVLIK